MKMRVIALIVMLAVLVSGTCYAASYTLPEKMYNQLSIGSGLKGTFAVTAEGEKFNTPFLNSITDAEWSLRGIRSGNDLHYYVVQSNEQDEQCPQDMFARAREKGDDVIGKSIHIFTSAKNIVSNRTFFVKQNRIPDFPFSFDRKLWI